MTNTWPGLTGARVMIASVVASLSTTSAGKRPATIPQDTHGAFTTCDMAPREARRRRM